MSLFNYPSSFDSVQDAAIECSPVAFSNSSENIDGTYGFPEGSGDDAFDGANVKLLPGAKIFFYSTENENVFVGPKLQSKNLVKISFVNPDEKLNCYMPGKAKNLFQGSIAYSVLKSGVLVPHPCTEKIRGNLLKFDVCNKCVYHSLKPIFYVRGFKNILIPVDVLYSKSKQNELFDPKYLEKKSLPITDSWEVNDSSETGGLKKSKIGVQETGGGVPEPMKSYIESISRKHVTASDHAGKSEWNLCSDESESEILPDKSCNGEVTLFVLKSNGIFRRIPADPFMPIGLPLTYSLANNLMFRPKFMANSNVAISYVTGRNGDLIPHFDNTDKITAEEGKSVSFMLSKSGCLFPVKEEMKANNFISYFFDGRLVHETQQFSRVYSNSSSVLVNDKKCDFSGRDNKGKHLRSSSLNEIFEKPAVKSDKTHRLQKRDAYFHGYDRIGSSSPQSPLELHSAMRHVPAGGDQNRMSEHPAANARSHTHFPGRQLVSSQLPSNLPTEPRYLEAFENFAQAPSKTEGSSYSEMNSKSGPSCRLYGSTLGDAEQLEHQKEEPPPDMGSSAWEHSPLKPRTDLFIFDEKGTRKRLIPEITDDNDVVIYKLTCKGNLVRYPSCREPEFGFEINFQLLLDEFVLVPITAGNKRFQITYVLQENGDLTPSENNANTFRKAPGSLIYYMLGKNNILFPVQQVIDMEGHVSFYYQDFFLLKMKDSIEKPLHFTTKGSPLFAFFNGFTMITMSSKPRLNPLSGSNWKQLKSSEHTEPLPKTMYLTGPKGELIKIAPYKNKQGATVIYELDCNGILYRSPKDKKKCIILKSYILLKEGILLPSNDTNGYVYMMSKNGDLFPYLYPEGKIEAPLASSFKYVLCEKGILLPIKLEIIDNSICYIFRDVVVYKERVYCRSCLDRLDEEQLDHTRKHKKSSCDLQLNDPDRALARNIKLFTNKNGDHVFYEKQNKILKRYPPEEVPSYLKYTMGSFQIKSDGSLYQIRYQDPGENVVNLMLEPNGDLLEDTRNSENLRSQYYVLDAEGNLISVEGRRTKKNLHLYKGAAKICKVPIPRSDPQKTDVPVVQQTKTPLGRDPFGLMEDPYPPKSDGPDDTRSLYIPIPLKSVTVSDSPDACLDCPSDPEHKRKCDMLKDTLSQVSKGDSLPLALELELTDDIIQELKNWATKCDRVFSRREGA